MATSSRERLIHAPRIDSKGSTLVVAADPRRGARSTGKAWRRIVAGTSRLVLVGAFNAVLFGGIGFSFAFLALVLGERHAAFETALVVNLVMFCEGLAVLVGFGLSGRGPLARVLPRWRSLW